jgi:hypothetical protein
MNDSKKTEQRVEADGAAREQAMALPFSSPLELWCEFKAGAKFVLHYHGASYEVERMEPREKVVYVQPPRMAVKVFPDGRGAEGTSAIWLEKKAAFDMEPLQSHDPVSTP